MTTVGCEQCCHEWDLQPYDCRVEFVPRCSCTWDPHASRVRATTVVRHTPLLLLHESKGSSWLLDSLDCDTDRILRVATCLAQRHCMAGKSRANSDACVKCSRRIRRVFVTARRAADTVHQFCSQGGPRSRCYTATGSHHSIEASCGERVGPTCSRG